MSLFRIAFYIVLIIVTGSALIYGFLIEPRQVKIKRYSIRLQGLPTAWQGRKIAFFSDLHAGIFYPPSHLVGVFDKLLDLEPDLICIGGDFIEERTRLKDTKFRRRLVEQLSRLRAAKGTYAVLGNHDAETKENLRYVRTLLADSKITLLSNEAVMLDGLCLIGLQESYHQRPDLAAATADCHTQKTMNTNARIILMHQPDDLPTPEATSNTDLILSGHSHRGQITLFGLPLYTVKGGRKRLYGHYFLPSGAQQITTSGLGTVHIYARFFAPPEITLIEVKMVDNSL
jgi:predicted MPP superfamily phosphohydrolase